MKQQSVRTNQLIELEELVKEISAALPPPPTPIPTGVSPRTPAEELQLYLVAQLSAYCAAHSGELDPYSQVLVCASTPFTESSEASSRKESNSNE